MTTHHKKRTREERSSLNASQPLPIDDLLVHTTFMLGVAQRWMDRCTRLHKHLAIVEEKLKVLRTGGTYLKRSSDVVSHTLSPIIMDGPVGQVLEHLDSFDEVVWSEWECDQDMLQVEGMVSSVNVFTALPAVLLSHIFGFLPQCMLSDTALVCKRFSQFVRVHPRHHVIVPEKTVFTPTVAKQLARYRPRRLELQGSATSIVSMAGIKQLGLFASLRQLSISECAEDTHLPFIAGLNALQSLALWKCTKLTGATVASRVAGLKNLKMLQLSNCNMRNSDVVHLCHSLPKLNILRLHWNIQLTDEIMSHLPSGLKELALTTTGITDAGLGHLTALTTLRFLAVNACRGITDAGVASLTGLNNLEQLYIGEGCQLTDASIPLFLHLTRLQTLGLRETAVTDSGLLQLTELIRLSEMRLNRCAGVTSGCVALLRARGVISDFP